MKTVLLLLRLLLLSHFLVFEIYKHHERVRPQHRFTNTSALRAALSDGRLIDTHINSWE